MRRANRIDLVSSFQGCIYIIINRDIQRVVGGTHWISIVCIRRVAVRDQPGGDSSGCGSTDRVKYDTSLLTLS